MSGANIDFLIDRYKTNKDKIPFEYKEMFTEYYNALGKLDRNTISEGDRYYNLKCFMPALKKFVGSYGFNVFCEVDLFNPGKKVTILTNEIVKDKLSDLKEFKSTKNIDLIAISDIGKKIIFIEVKMDVKSPYLLNGLFELGMIEKRKLPKGYEVYFILMSALDKRPEKHRGVFEVYKRFIIAEEDLDKCQFILLDPKNCYNEMKFCKNILA